VLPPRKLDPLSTSLELTAGSATGGAVGMEPKVLVFSLTMLVRELGTIATLVRPSLSIWSSTLSRPSDLGVTCFFLSFSIVLEDGITFLSCFDSNSSSITLVLLSCSSLFFTSVLSSVFDLSSLFFFLPSDFLLLLRLSLLSLFVSFDFLSLLRSLRLSRSR